MEIQSSQFDLGDPRHYEQCSKDHELSFVPLRVLLSFVEDFLSSGKDFPAISPCFCLKSLKNKLISNSPNTSSLAGDSWLMELSSRLALCLLPNRLGSHPINKE